MKCALRVLDCFLLEGTSSVVATGVAIVEIFRKRLENSPFEDCIKLLSCSPGQQEAWEVGLLVLYYSFNFKDIFLFQV